MDPDDAVDIVRSIATTHLWFDAFVFLLRLLGINVENDALPESSEYSFSTTSTTSTTNSTSPSTTSTTNSTSPSTTNSTSPSTTNSTALRNESNQTARTTPVALYSTGTESLATALAEQKVRYKKNSDKIKTVMRQLSAGSNFLPVDLADEAVLLLTQNMMNHSAMAVCLHRLKIDSSVSFADEPADNRQGSSKIKNNTNNNLINNNKMLRYISVTPNSRTIFDISPSQERISEVFDWTKLNSDFVSWPQEVLHIFQRLSYGTGGFVSKSQAIEFVRTASPILWGRKPNDPQDDSNLKIPLEMFDSILRRLGYSLSSAHSRILWVVCAVMTNHETVPHFINSKVLADCIARIYLQPCNTFGHLLPVGSSVGTDCYFAGGLTFRIYLKLMRIVGVTLPSKGMIVMWKSIPKSPIILTEFLRPLAVQSLHSNFEVILRLKMENNGLDIRRGRFITIENFRRYVPYWLQTGLWNEITKTILKTSLKSSITIDELCQFVSSDSLNAFGMIRPSKLPPAVSAAFGEGMSLTTLTTLIRDMDIKLTQSQIRKMFAMMDINRDDSLALDELLGGFSIIFSQTVPEAVIESLGCSQSRQLGIVLLSLLLCLVLFLFLSLASASFQGAAGATSTVMQSFLAVVGAVSVRSGSRQDPVKLEKRLMEDLEGIFGADLGRRIRKVKRDDQLITRTYQLQKLQIRKLTHQIVGLSYEIPARNAPDLRDSCPCITFRRGETVRLQPSVREKWSSGELAWTIMPPLPSDLGLKFETQTGCIVGTINLSFRLGWIVDCSTPPPPYPKLDQILLAVQRNHFEKTREAFIKKRINNNNRTGNRLLGITGVQSTQQTGTIKFAERNQINNLITIRNDSKDDPRSISNIKNNNNKAATINRDLINFEVLDAHRKKHNKKKRKKTQAMSLTDLRKSSTSDASGMFDKGHNNKHHHRNSDRDNNNINGGQEIKLSFTVIVCSEKSGTASTPLTFKVID